MTTERKVESSSRHIDGKIANLVDLFTNLRGEYLNGTNTHFYVEKICTSSQFISFIEGIKQYQKEIAVCGDDVLAGKFTSLIERFSTAIGHHTYVYDVLVAKKIDDPTITKENIVKLINEIGAQILDLLREIILAYYKKMAQCAELKLDSLDAVQGKVNGIHNFNQLKAFKNKFLELNDYLGCVLEQRNGDNLLFNNGLESFNHLFQWLLKTQNLTFIDIKAEKEKFLLQQNILDLFSKNPEELNNLEKLRHYTLHSPGKPSDHIPSLKRILNVLRYLVGNVNGDAVSDQMGLLYFEKEIYYSLNLKLLEKSIQRLTARKKTPLELLNLAIHHFVNFRAEESKDENENERNIETCKLLFELDQLDQATINQEDGSLARMAYRSLSQAAQIQLEKNVNSNDRYILARVIHQINQKMKDPEADYELADFKPLFDGRADWSWSRLALAALLLIAGAGLLAVGILAASATAGMSIPLAANYGVPLIAAGASLFAGGMFVGRSARPYGFAAELSKNVNCFYASLSKEVPEEKTPEHKPSPKGKA